MVVSPDEAAELEELTASVDGASEPVGARPFDGVVVVQAEIPLTAAAVAILKDWVKARFEQKKSQTVVVRGAKFMGYSADEIRELFAWLDKELTQS
ncbi:hypothetical protein EV646_11758 [Kribbella antiqua]|uniref:Uncharacterized protein n=1 Tax=Kribbella antiqua TaxID=2512217 RepID=A0A4R2I8Q5_9ACTN|nr:hypothetical protein EV646_11758 [Kribbella antiqua]